MTETKTVEVTRERFATASAKANPALVAGPPVNVLQGLLALGAEHQRPRSKEFSEGRFDAEADAEFIVAAIDLARLASQSLSSPTEVERLREALQVADDALCEYACHGGDGVPCLRTLDQCNSECGKRAGNALLTVREALEGKDHSHVG